MLLYCGLTFSSPVDTQCGEAFAAWLPGWGVPFSYAVAISYVLTDTYDKWARARTQAKQELDSIDLDPAVAEGRSVERLHHFCL